MRRTESNDLVAGVGTHRDTHAVAVCDRGRESAGRSPVHRRPRRVRPVAVAFASRTPGNCIEAVLASRRARRMPDQVVTVSGSHGRSQTARHACRHAFTHVALIAETALIRKISHSYTKDVCGPDGA